ncbi:MAG: hypothetical protein AB7E66_02525, partial [Parvibaculaceae bacterium]
MTGSARQHVPLGSEAGERAVALAWERLYEAHDAATVERLEAHRPLLDRLFAGSPFLAELVLREPAFAVQCIEGHPDELLKELIDGLKARTAPEAAEADVRAALRQERAKAALLIAIADIGGAWSLEQVTAALTR